MKEKKQEKMGAPEEKKNEGANKIERSEEKGIRAYFVRLFGKYDFRNEKQFLYFGKWMIFILLLLVEALALLQVLDGFYGGGWGRFIVCLGIVFLLTLSSALHLFAARGKWRIIFYVLDMVASCAFLYFGGKGVYPLVLYMLILTQFYFETKRTKHSVLLLFVGIFVYMLAYGIQLYFVEGTDWNFLQLLSLTFGFIVGIIFHFILTQIALAFYRQYLKLGKALRDLSESKKELERAYEAVAEVTVLEERQRIAKEIHDTAGHSLTTVIMQTEAAKRMIESSPDEAKNKIISANLQAKHALEELRNGVHLLSGAVEHVTLADALTGIIQESTDGTGITIRSEIADVEVSAEKYRFLCNTLKEGISNGMRHGGATAFWFELKVEEGELRFLLSDNGKGVGKEGLQKGFGLTTMQQRADALGGTLTFFCEEDEGFEIHLKLPVDGEKEECDG